MPEPARKALAKKLKESNQSSDALDKPPENDIYTSWYKKTFYTLSRSRQTGMSIGYIPVSEIIDYGNNVGHVENKLEDFIDNIQAMDYVFLSHQNKK